MRIPSISQFRQEKDATCLRSGYAYAACYLGLLSPLFIFFAPLAVLIGILAISDIKKHPGTIGTGFAIIGILAGSIFSILLVAVVTARLNGHH